jgi:molybdopterin synthase catalytic subunit
MAQIALTPFDPAAALSSLMHGRTDGGALASFVGYVRGQNDQVTSLRLDHYPAYTQRWMDAIEADAKARFDVLETCIIHRAGLLVPGDPIVLVAAISLHRKPAIHCVDFLMDRLKTDAPFWKQETGLTASQWIEPRVDDYTARQAWDMKHD